MGYRDLWLANAGSVARHREVFLHVADRLGSPERVLLAGAENGGSVEIWEALGASVTAVDSRPMGGPLADRILTGDISDRRWVTDALRGSRFDLIVDCTGTMTGNLWPYLTAGGRYVFEGYETGMITDLSRSIAEDVPGWLPVEEILFLSVFPHVALIEKRHPRVLPYLEVLTGNFTDSVPEHELRVRGVKRVLVD